MQQYEKIYKINYLVFIVMHLQLAFYSFVFNYEI